MRPSNASSTRHTPESYSYVHQTRLPMPYFGGTIACQSSVSWHGALSVLGHSVNASLDGSVQQHSEFGATQNISSGIGASEAGNCCQKLSGGTTSPPLSPFHCRQ